MRETPAERNLRLATESWEAHCSHCQECKPTRSELCPVGRRLYATLAEAELILQDEQMAYRQGDPGPHRL